MVAIEQTMNLWGPLAHALWMLHLLGRLLWSLLIGSANVVQVLQDQETPLQVHGATAPQANSKAVATYKLSVK